MECLFSVHLNIEKVDLSPPLLLFVKCVHIFYCFFVKCILPISAYLLLSILLSLLLCFLLIFFQNSFSFTFLAILLFIITFKCLFQVRSQRTISVKSHRIFKPLWPCGLWCISSALVSQCERNHRQYIKNEHDCSKKLFTTSGDSLNLALRLQFAKTDLGVTV